jgi:glycosyltransferase involved in cell wall biosynthesis
VDVFLSPSQFLANTISERIVPEKIVVLQNGIDPIDFRKNFRDEGYCLFLGRISQEKGIVTLLKAHKKIWPNLELKIAGTGPAEEALKSQFKDAQFLGYKSGKALEKIIANAGFIVAPSECNENCSMAILEAMAAGKPVIGSNIGGIPEQVVEGETGYLFESGNFKELSEKMLLLAKNPQLRAQMGNNAMQRLESCFSKELHCSQLVDIYSQLL